MAEETKPLSSKEYDAIGQGLLEKISQYAELPQGIECPDIFLCGITGRAAVDGILQMSFPQITNRHIFAGTHIIISCFVICHRSVS